MFKMQVIFYRALMLLIKVVNSLVPQGKPLLLTGQGSALDMCRTMAQFGHKRVLLISDTVLRGLGVLDPLVAEMEASGISVTIYDGVKPDPDFSQIEEGVAAGRAADCDAVLAVGGGSPIDTAKVVAAAIPKDKRVADLVGIQKVKTAGLPLYVVPTTAGTGSEVTVAAVITNEETHEKDKVIDPVIMPVAAALDASIQKGMPPHITAATGMDALTHAIESYLSGFATEETERYSLAAVRMIFKQLPEACSDGEDMQAREAMAMASTYAGLAFTKAYVGYVHAIAHQYGGRYGTPHGLANAIVLPYILEYSMDEASGRMADLAVAAGLGERGLGDAELARHLVDGVRALNAQIGIPTQLDALKTADIPAIAKDALKEAHYLYPVPKYMDRAQCESIVRKMLP